MEILGRKELESLLEINAAHCLSIYLPIQGLGAPQDTTRYKNLLVRAEKMLAARGLRAVEAAKLLAAEYDLLKALDYWRNLGAAGMAVFISPEWRERFILPRKFNEAITISERFRVKPLIPLITGDGRYFVLALSKKNCRLFIGSRFSINETTLPAGAPTNMEMALQYDDPQRQLQFHTQTASVGGKRQAMFHGHGVGIDDELPNVKRYLQMLANHLQPVFFNEKIPVVLAGNSALPSTYQELDTSEMLVRQFIDSNPDSMSTAMIHQKSWELVAPLFAAEETRARKKFEELHGTGLALNELEAILPAAYGGRVETLFIDEALEEWGVFEPMSHQLTLTAAEFPGAMDIIDQTVAWTLANSGEVYVKNQLEMPAVTGMAAVLRF